MSDHNSEHSYASQDRLRRNSNSQSNFQDETSSIFGKNLSSDRHPNLFQETSSSSQTTGGRSTSSMRSTPTMRSTTRSSEQTTFGNYTYEQYNQNTGSSSVSGQKYNSIFASNQSPSPSLPQSSHNSRQQFKNHYNTSPISTNEYNDYRDSTDHNDTTNRLQSPNPENNLNLKETRIASQENKQSHPEHRTEPFAFEANNNHNNPEMSHQAIKNNERVDHDRWNLGTRDGSVMVDQISTEFQRIFKTGITRILKSMVRNVENFSKFFKN